MKLKCVCAGVLAGVVAASAVVLPVEPVSVFADAGEFAGAIDYALGITGTDLYSGVTAGVTGFTWVVAALVGIQAYNDIVDGATDQGFTAGDLNTITFCGYYNENGDFRKLTSCGVSGLQNLTFIYADDFNIASQTTNSNGVTYTSGYTLAYPNDVYASGYFSTWAVAFSGMARYTFASGSSSPFPTLLTSDSIGKYFTGQYGSPTYIAKTIETVTLPEPLSMTNGNYGDAYIRDVLKPYVEENYPDMMYVFAPSYTPEYPTDFVTGIPKDWTITNPELPEIPDLDFQIPTADFDSLDVSPVRQNLSGVGFWWDLLETVLDTSAFKELFIAFAIIGLAIFVLWKLGA